MSEDLRPDADQLAAHRDHLKAAARGPLKDVEWDHMASKRVHSLYVVYGYGTVTDEGTHAAFIHEDYDELDVIIFDPLPFPAESVAPTGALASV